MSNKPTFSTLPSLLFNGPTSHSRRSMFSRGERQASQLLPWAHDIYIGIPKRPMSPEGDMTLPEIKEPGTASLRRQSVNSLKTMTAHIFLLAFCI